MTRSALALLGLLALPAAAAAQDRPTLSNEPPAARLPENRFSLTPYIGVRVPSGGGDQLILTESGNQFRLENNRGGSVLLGLDADVRVAGPWSIVLGGAYSSAQQDELTAFFPDDEDPTLFEIDGPAVWFAKAGVRVRLPDPLPDNRRFHPSAFVTVAPAMVWLDYGDVEGIEGIDGTTSHFALNLGAEAVARFGRSSAWAFSLGVEDYITFYDTDDLRARDAVVAQIIAEEPVVIDYDSNFSNVIALRFGVSYRFQ
jgi:hypothetical protein